MSRRHLRRLVFALLVLPAAALAGSGFRMTIVPVPPKCDLGECLNGGGSCSIDADCNGGTLSAKSSLQFDGKHLVLKASIKGATDRFGAPLQTDGIAGTADDYILELDGNRRDYTDILCVAPGCPEAMVVGKVDFKKGKAKVVVDISTFIPSVLNGSPFRLRGGSLRLPPRVPADCPGDNSAAGLTMRSGDVRNCVTGAVLGMGGFVAGE